MLSAKFLQDLTKLCNEHSIDTLCGCSDAQVAGYIYDSIDALQKINRAIRIQAQIELYKKIEDGGH